MASGLKTGLTAAGWLQVPLIISMNRSSNIDAQKERKKEKAVATALELPLRIAVIPSATGQHIIKRLSFVGTYVWGTLP